MITTEKNCKKFPTLNKRKELKQNGKRSSIDFVKALHSAGQSHRIDTTSSQEYKYISPLDLAQELRKQYNFLCNIPILLSINKER